MNSRVLVFIFVSAIIISTVTCLPDAMLSPPGRPDEFRNPEQLRRYLKALNDYYAIVGRPRIDYEYLWDDRLPRDTYDVIGDDNIPFY